MKNFYLKICFFLVVFCGKPIFAQSITETFDNIAVLSGNGWVLQNNSVTAGSTSWFQGNPISAGGPFDAYNGATTSYIGANYNNVSGSGTISNWMMTPNRTFRNGDVITFYTRKASPDNYADRLEVRLSSNGASTNAGSAGSVGDFGTLLFSINPSLVLGVYPTTWTQYTVTISGLPAPTSGRVAFRYFVTSGGFNGSNSDYIGVDAFTYTPYVCPAFTMTTGGALTGGTAGEAYSTTLSQTGALGSPSFAITAGALPPGLTLSTSGTISGTPTATGTFNFTAAVSDASACSGSQSYSITVVCPANPITIASFPALCSNSSPYTLTGASPAGGTYSGTGVTGGQFDPAAGTQTITYDYTDPYGCAFSRTKVITVNVAPSLTTQPSSSTICTGANTFFSVAATNATSYQWQVNTGSGFTNIVNGAPYSGATTSTVIIIGATAGMNGYTYRALVSGSTGCDPVTSNSVALTVNSAPAITTQPSASTICAGANTAFSAVASNATGYQWQVNTGSGYTNVTNGAPYSGATTATLTVTGATASLNGYLYRVVATGTCTPAVTSNSVALTVNSAPAITTQPSASTICAGANTAFSAVASNATGYQWQVNTGSGYTNVTNGAPYSGATTATLTVTGATASLTGYLYRVVSTGTCTPAVTSNGVSLTVSSTNAPTGVATQSFSSGDTLSVLVVTGENIKWYATAENASSHTNVLPMTTVIVNNTTYYATQTVGSCESQTSLAVKAYNETLGVSTNPSKLSIQLYPNPVKEVLHFSGQDKINKIVIMSIDGKKVSEKTMNGERKLNVHSLVQGTYLISIITDNGVQTIKFIKD